MTESANSRNWFAAKRERPSCLVFLSLFFGKWECNSPLCWCIFFLILGSFPVQESEGFNLPSLDGTAGLFHLKGGLQDLDLHRVLLPLTRLTQNEPYEHRHVIEPFMSALEQSFKKPKDDYVSPRAARFHRSHWKPNGGRNTSLAPHGQPPEPTPHWQGEQPSISPSMFLIPSSQKKRSPAPVPSPAPIISPRSSLKKTVKPPSPSPVLALPPPPPNQDCTKLICTEPMTYSAAGLPCKCVWPVEVSLKLNVTLYTFFPLVSELSKEIATSLLLDPSQVRIMGANEANQQLEKTVVIMNLVPLQEQFDGNTAYLIYRKFWKRKVYIQPSVFGTYEVVYVRYPGLPPSPPQLSSETATIASQPYPRSDNDGRAIKPLGVDVPRRKRHATGRNVVIVIVLSCIATIVLCLGIIWLLSMKYRCCILIPRQTSDVSISSQQKPSGSAGSLLLGSSPASVSMSVGSSILGTYAGTARIFSLSDIERATNNFDASNILGEGGFGIVYSGILEGTQVAVKLLKRIDHQGSREYLAEIEMLSRLHHRNLVKLIGICAEVHTRCLVYELVPNGSVESHLHGIEKESSPLDWQSRMKIALGAGRGLAYLHEDSNPPVIHRDFKASNILLEHDFTPKVSDFGLARAALEEQNKHISTHIMGTFGYLAPEYAMTGHLLVKSDVYSYGVVLLELLTGRKPVDFSQPPGQENLVAWARPLLTSQEGLETIIDPVLKAHVTSDSLIKFAAIASMCVQPEVSHRPFMGEVVQALKLVSNEFDEAEEVMSRSWSQEEHSVDVDSRLSRISGEIGEASHPYSILDRETNSDNKIALSTTNLVNDRFTLESESFRRQFNSAPLKLGRKKRFWERLRGSSRGSMSEHGFQTISHC